MKPAAAGPLRMASEVPEADDAGGLGAPAKSVPVDEILSGVSKELNVDLVDKLAEFFDLENETRQQLAMMEAEAEPEYDIGEDLEDGLTHQAFDEQMDEELRHGVRFNIRGAHRTSPAFLQREFDLAGKLAGAPPTTRRVLSSVAQGLEAMKGLDIFDDMSVAIDIAEDGALEVVLDIEEQSVVTGHVGGDHGAGDITGNVGFGIKNAFGHAEKLTVQGAMGATSSNSISLSGAVPVYGSSSSYDVTYEQPRTFGTKWRSSVAAYRSEINRVRHSSFVQRNTGVRISTSNARSPHSFFYSFQSRGVIPRKQPESAQPDGYKGPSPAVLREGVNPSVKSSLNYSFQSSTLRGQPAVPSGGHQLLSHVEVAGLGGDVQHVKGTASASYHHSLSGSAADESLGTLHFGARAGAVVPLGRLLPARFSDKRTRIIDRLEAGGPLLARGFQKIGPRDGFDYVNADYQVSTGVSWTYPLTFLGSYLNLFASSCWGSLHQEGGGVAAQAQNLFKAPSQSAGAGLVLPIPAVGGRLELGFAHPLRSQGDPFSRFYWGFSAAFF